MGEMIGVRREEGGNGVLGELPRYSPCQQVSRSQDVSNDEPEVLVREYLAVVTDWLSLSPETLNPLTHREREGRVDQLAVPPVLCVDWVSECVCVCHGPMKACHWLCPLCTPYVTRPR